MQSYPTFLRKVSIKFRISFPDRIELIAALQQLNDVYSVQTLAPQPAGRQADNGNRLPSLM